MPNRYPTRRAPRSAPDGYDLVTFNDHGRTRNAYAPVNLLDPGDIEPRAFALDPGTVRPDGRVTRPTVAAPDPFTGREHATRSRRSNRGTTTTDVTRYGVAPVVGRHDRDADGRPLSAAHTGVVLALSLARDRATGRNAFDVLNVTETVYGDLLDPVTGADGRDRDLLGTDVAMHGDATDTGNAGTLVANHRADITGAAPDARRVAHADIERDADGYLPDVRDDIERDGHPFDIERDGSPDWQRVYRTGAMQAAPVTVTPVRTVTRVRPVQVRPGAYRVGAMPDGSPTVATGPLPMLARLDWQRVRDQVTGDPVTGPGEISPTVVPVVGPVTVHPWETVTWNADADRPTGHGHLVHPTRTRIRLNGRTRATDTGTRHAFGPFPTVTGRTRHNAPGQRVTYPTVAPAGWAPHPWIAAHLRTVPVTELPAAHPGTGTRHASPIWRGHHLVARVPRTRRAAARAAQRNGTGARTLATEGDIGPDHTPTTTDGWTTLAESLTPGRRITGTTSAGDGWTLSRGGSTWSGSVGTVTWSGRRSAAAAGRAMWARA